MIVFVSLSVGLLWMRDQVGGTYHLVAGRDAEGWSLRKLCKALGRTKKRRAVGGAGWVSLRTTTLCAWLVP